MGRRKKGRAVHGWLILDKPYDMGSTEAVSKVRWLFDAQKAGHAGTLDPLATGLLPIALGEGTKTVPYVQDGLKTYRFTARWGEARSTDDLEGDVTGTSDVRPDRAAVEAMLPDFTGTITQVPPAFSAIKIDGERAYDLARAGADIEMKTRQVRIDGLRLEHFTTDKASFSVDCGKGTYVRSLARDICEALDLEGHVSHLRRTRVGPFTLSQSFTLDALEQVCDSARAEEALLALSTALDDIPVLAVTDKQQANLKQGRAIAAPSSHHHAQWVLAEADGIAIALCQPRDGQLWPKRVFNI